MFPYKEYYSEKPTKCRLNGCRDAVSLQQYCCKIEMKYNEVCKKPQSLSFLLGQQHVQAQWRIKMCFLSDVF